MSKVYRLEFHHIVDVIADTEDEAISLAEQELDGEGMGMLASIEEIEPYEKEDARNV